NWKLTPRDKNDIEGFYTDTTTIGINLLNDQDIRLKLYPNPAKSQVFVEGSINEATQLSVRIFDLNGKLLLSDKQSVVGDFLINLDVNQLNSGLYFIEINANNEKSTISKFYKN
ncbi:MAG: T9SS type A sorting domain-containing protein, partial [Bacteroidetes bacterium]|nr:T9SS type A sorting domain-containing protein [Bacteroidota bacterium]